MKNLVKESLNEDEYDDTASNFKRYEEIVSRKPYVKEIVEDILSCSPRYRIDKVDEDDKGRITLWISKSGSMTVYFTKPEEIQYGLNDLLLKHKVSIQVPGNQDYGFTISIRN